MKYTQGFVSCLSQRFSSAVAKRTWLWLSRSHPVLIILVFVAVINCRCFCCCQADERHWLCTNNAGSQPLMIIFVFLVAVVKLTHLVLIHILLQYFPRSFLRLLPSTKQLLAKIARWKGHSILLDFLYSCAFQINLIDFLFSCPFPDQGGHWELVGGRQNWWSRDSCTEGKD